MAEIVYTLCAVASLVCAGLLLRSYLANRARLILWMLLCFTGLALNNVLLFLDEVVTPGDDIITLRAVPAALGALALCYGLIMDTRE